MSAIKSHYVRIGVLLLCSFAFAFSFQLQAAEVSINLEYDDNGRLIQIDYGTKTISYTYDANGNLLNRTVSNSSAQANSKLALRSLKPTTPATVPVDTQPTEVSQSQSDSDTESDSDSDDAQPQP